MTNTAKPVEFRTAQTHEQKVKQTDSVFSVSWIFAIVFYTVHLVFFNNNITNDDDEDEDDDDDNNNMYIAYYYTVLTITYRKFQVACSQLTDT